MATDKKKAKNIDKRENKVTRICSHFSNQRLGEFNKPTPTAKLLGIHPDTYREFIDLGESYEEIGIENIRDRDGKLLGSRRVNKNSELKKEIRTMKQEILHMRDAIDEVKDMLREGLKK